MELKNIELIINENFRIDSILKTFTDVTSYNDDKEVYLYARNQHLKGKTFNENFDDKIYYYQNNKMIQIEINLSYNKEKGLGFSINHNPTDELTTVMGLVSEYIKTLRWFFNSEIDYVTYINLSKISMLCCYYGQQNSDKNIIYQTIRLNPNMDGSKINYLTEEHKRLLTECYIEFKWDYQLMIIESYQIDALFDLYNRHNHFIDCQNIDQIRAFNQINEIVDI